MAHPEYQYLSTLQDILDHGEKVSNRTGVDTLRLLGVTHRYDFRNGFPLLTTKKVWFKGVVHELLWFLSGSTNIKYLVDNDVNIWNDDAYNFFKKHVPDSDYTKEKYIGLIETIHPDSFAVGVGGFGELGPVYGAQWRNWTKIRYGGYDKYGDCIRYDQVSSLVERLKNDPCSRRHIISAWNVAEIDEMALPPCHVLSQFTISNGALWCHMYQRSADWFLGVPFNIASYSLLTYMIAQVCDLKPGGFIHTIHDAHLYVNHTEAALDQLCREPRAFPRLELNPDISNIDNFKYEDIKVVNYDPHPAIKAELNT